MALPMSFFPDKSRLPVNRSIFLQIASQTCRSPLEKLNFHVPHSSRFTGLGGGGSPSNFLGRIGGECRSGNIFDFERGGAMSARPFRPGWNAGFAAVWRQKAFLPAILRRTPRRIKADCAFQMPEFFAGIPACCEGRSWKAPR